MALVVIDSGSTSSSATIGSSGVSSILNFDFLNMVKTCEVDYVYDASTTSQIDAKISQCYNPMDFYWLLLSFSIVVFYLVKCFFNWMYE